MAVEVSDLEAPPRVDRPRAITARILDETRKWFARGDDLGEESMDGDYLEPDGRVRSALLHGGLILAGLTVSLLSVLLLT